MTKFDNTWFAWKWRIVGALIGLVMAAPMFIMAAKAGDITVSYTHLTLPTNREV